MPKPTPDRTHHRGLHVLVILTAIAVFPLVIVGAGVTSKDAGMAFPDWPTSNGYLLNPPQWWQIEPMRWEHGHRLIGWIVGMLAIAVAVVAWPRRGTTRTLGIAILLAIIVQGVLGGLRVTEISTALAMIHGIAGQACFTLVCCMALMTSRAWATRRAALKVPAGNLLQWLCVAAAASVFIQLVLGAALRHFPSDALLIVHLLWAVVVALIAGWIVVWVIGLAPRRNAIELLGSVFGALMIIQLLLGGLAWVATLAGGFRSPLLQWLIPSAHVAIGALLLACSAMLVLAAFHFARPLPATTRAADAAPVPAS